MSVDNTKGLNPVTKNRLHESIVAQLRGKILNGDFACGEKLPPERDLAETFRVNRATVREALKKLEQLGLIEIIHGDGIYVRDYLKTGTIDLMKEMIYGNGDTSLSLIAQLQTLRRLLIPEMAARAAGLRSDRDVQEMAGILEKGEEIHVMEADLAIHGIVARACGNLPYIFLLNSFNRVFLDFGYIYFGNPDNEKRSRRFHRELYEAILSGNAEKSRKVMSEVLEYTEKALLGHVDPGKDTGTGSGLHGSRTRAKEKRK